MEENIKVLVKEEDIYKAAIKSWASKNLDLLTPAEMKKYHEIIA